MCKLLVDQFNSVFTTPDQSKIVIDSELFFSVDENSVNESPHLSTIVFTDEIVLLAIKELSHNSAAGPDGIPASLLLLFASSSDFFPLINPVVPGLDRRTPRSCLLAYSIV